ncbi:MAG: hypothetical protein ACFB9N_16240 [Geitlerinemataceae cyanobacterium]|mgnify:CR=1 FL=1
MRFFRLLGEKGWATLLAMRVFWRPMLLLALAAHVLLLRARLPGDSVESVDVVEEEALPLEPVEEEFVEITALVGDGEPPPKDDSKPEKSEGDSEPEPEPEPNPDPDPDPDPEPEPDDEPEDDEPKDAEDEEPDDKGNDKDGGDEDGGDGDDGGDDGGGDDDGGGGSGDTGTIDLLKDRVFSRLTAGGDGVNDTQAIRQQLDSFPKVDDVDAQADRSKICPERGADEVCDPVAGGTAYGALRLPQIPQGQAELMVVGGDPNSEGIFEVLRFESELIGRIGDRGSAKVYHVTPGEGNNSDIEFYIGFAKIFGGGQTLVVLWNENPLE